MDPLTDEQAEAIGKRIIAELGLEQNLHGLYNTDHGVKNTKGVARLLGWIFKDETEKLELKGILNEVA